MAQEAKSLKIPFALDESGSLIRPEHTEKGKTYQCPACLVNVVAKNGQIKKPHFAHKVSASCSLETITHKTAKVLIEQVVLKWKRGEGPVPELVRPCQQCHQDMVQKIPEKVDSVALEYRLDDGSIGDVVLLSQGVAQAVIEIRVTHTVDEVKAARLSLPYLELDGFKIVENPLFCESLADSFKSFTCASCKENLQRFMAKVKRISEKTGVEIPQSYYRYTIRHCYKCKEEILVFSWPEKTLHTVVQPKHKDKPKTIKFQYAHQIEQRYWVNTCPYCDAIQGDWFVFVKDESHPRFRVGEDTHEAFERDLFRQAVLYSIWEERQED